MVRKPIVSGKFYPSDAETLREMISSFISTSSPLAGEAHPTVSSPLAGEVRWGGKKISTIGAIVPHAGYVCSGEVAGAVYSRLSVPELVVILGPNHTGLGPTFSLMTEGIWQTPLGETAVSFLAKDLLKKSSLLREDDSAHQLEHSLEVQLPFLQFGTQKPFDIIPIVVGSLNEPDLLKLGKEMAEFIREGKKETLIIASSDMTHYEPDEVARKKDKYALEAILALDPKLLLSRTKERDISMCGVGPATIMLAAAKELGAKRAELVKYNTSGDTCGDKYSVVGYAGVIIT